MKFIDLMAMYKQNKFHWHLTEDQGWRIQIDKYPLLTEVGAWRKETAWHSGIGNGIPHGGFYTKDDIREVVEYARHRCIDVIPEVEIPGHCTAAIAAYPQLSCFPDRKYEVETRWGIWKNLYAPTAYTFQFLEDVFTELFELFPYELYHIGGDEAPKDVYRESQYCQDLMKVLGIDREEELQTFFVKRIGDFLKKHGKTVIGWDEILDGGALEDPIAMSYRGHAPAARGIRRGIRVILTPNRWCYLDNKQDDQADDVAQEIFMPLKKVYNYYPVVDSLADLSEKYIIGYETCLWTEYIPDSAKAEWMAFPRNVAASEVAWTSRPNKDWESFRVRVDKACQDLDRRGVNYHIPLPEQPGGSCDRIAFMDKAVLEFTTTRPVAAIVYTTDGSTPTVKSARYSAPLEFTDNTTLKIASVTSYGKLSPVRTISVTRLEPKPAVSAWKGLKAWRADGRFVTAAQLEDASWKEVGMERLRDLAGLEPFDRNMPDSTRFYAAKAEACFSVDETAVYRFSSDCDQVWIDGELLIDNGAEVKRFSRHDAETVLEAGAHMVRVIYLYNVIGGWNSIRNKTDVQIRKAGSGEWHRIRPL